jgi:hypothetical protein
MAELVSFAAREAAAIGHDGDGCAGRLGSTRPDHSAAALVATLVVRWAERNRVGREKLIVA